MSTSGLDVAIIVIRLSVGFAMRLVQRGLSCWKRGLATTGSELCKGLLYVEHGQPKEVLKLRSVDDEATHVGAEQLRLSFLAVSTEHHILS